MGSLASHKWQRCVNAFPFYFIVKDGVDVLQHGYYMPNTGHFDIPPEHWVESEDINCITPPNIPCQIDVPWGENIRVMLIFMFRENLPNQMGDDATWSYSMMGGSDYAGAAGYWEYPNRPARWGYENNIADIQVHNGGGYNYQDSVNHTDISASMENYSGWWHSNFRWTHKISVGTWHNDW